MCRAVGLLRKDEKEDSVELVNSISVSSPSGVKTIELFVGDLSALPVENAVDVIVISAFPNDYIPTPQSLIGALARRGLSIEEIAKNKEADLRESFSCWFSKEITHNNFNFKRVLCFEPLLRGRPSEVVGEIFQSLMPFVYGATPIKSVAMPLVASGDQGSGSEEMLQALLFAATNWLKLGMPVDVIKIVEISPSKVLLLNKVFETFKTQNIDITINIEQAETRSCEYDIFVSYSRDNTDATDFFCEEVLKSRPSTKIFVDKKDIDVGASWQQALYDALDNCRKIVTFLSSPYIKSRMCKEEFNIALLRHRESMSSIVYPIWLYSCNLPSYMKIINYMDCREFDKDKIRHASKNIVRAVS